MVLAMDLLLVNLALLWVNLCVLNRLLLHGRLVLHHNKHVDSEHRHLVSPLVIGHATDNNSCLALLVGRMLDECRTGQ